MSGSRKRLGGFGERYALPEVVEGLRAMRHKPADERLVAISGADPLNLVGVTAPGDRVPAVATNRVLYQDGVPIAARVAGAVRCRQQAPEHQRPAVLAALHG